MMSKESNYNWNKFVISMLIGITFCVYLIEFLFFSRFSSGQSCRLREAQESTADQRPQHAILHPGQVWSRTGAIWDRYDLEQLQSGAGTIRNSYNLGQVQSRTGLIRVWLRTYTIQDRYDSGTIKDGYDPGQVWSWKGTIQDTYDLRMIGMTWEWSV